MALLAEGKTDEAIEVFRKLLAARPEDTQALNSLAIALLKKGKTAEAIGVWEQLTRIEPQNAGVRHNLDGMRLVQWRDELRLNPADEQLMNNLAWVLATSPDDSLRSGKEAVQLAQKAVKLSGGKYAELFDTLAAAYAEAGQFADAVRTANEALEKATAQGNSALAESLRRRLKLYGEGKPWRDAPPSQKQMQAGK